MPILLDPEATETRTLLGLYPDFNGKCVLEIGCGDGRLTWRYAAEARRVAAIDPDPARLERALANRPVGFDHVEFQHANLEDFAARMQERFDLAILSWSL
jgi:2-polyprenyl-3-methyl-5-hydroxy-6-metoxy-1,4-benzoquinol methylase